MRYILTNFSYGNGPFLRSLELAFAINDRLEVLGSQRLGIIVPWVYGQRQRRIIKEDFAPDLKKRSQEVLLDAELGACLREVFYSGLPYERFLSRWVDSFEFVSDKAKKYLRGSGRDIALEVGRSPILSFGVSPSYSFSHGHLSEVLEKTSKVSSKIISLDRGLIKNAIPLARQLEESHEAVFLTEPGSFSYTHQNKPRHDKAIGVPLAIRPPKWNEQPIERGIYVTVSGIDRLDALYKNVQRLGLKIYTNDSQKIKGAVSAPVNILGNPSILFHVGRSGWGSVWLSLLAGKPYVALPYNSQDDPEIYFNNLCLERLGIGMIYRKQTVREILSQTEGLKLRMERFKKSLVHEYGNLDGLSYMAKKIIERTKF